MKVILANPTHPNGCIFAPNTYVDTYVTPCPAVFQDPRLNGGYIFFDAQPVPNKKGGGSDQRDLSFLFREDDEILAVIMAASQRWGFSGTIH